MELLWQSGVVQPRQEFAWVDGIVFSTKRYYRYLVDSGTLWIWDPATPIWTQVTGGTPAGLIQVNVRF